MRQFLKPFLLGVLCTGVIILVVFLTREHEISPGANGNEPEAEKKQTSLAISSDTVLISAIPAYKTLEGSNIAFRGKQRFQQNIAGCYAKRITIVSFRATGENSYKSAIIIRWEDGSLDLVPIGVTNMCFPPDKRAKEIVVQGYSVHERKVFRDSSRDGVLNWEILYEPIE